MGNASNANRQNVVGVPPRYSQPMSWENVQQRSPSSTSIMEALLKEYMAKNDAIIQSQVASLRALENQVGQIATALSSKKQEALSSDTEIS